MGEFILHALLAGIGVAIIAAPLGVFIVWRRMAYFGDTMAHSALLGVALGFILGINLQLGVVAVAGVMALIMLALQRQRQLASDTLLGILAHTSLSLGLIAIAMQEGVRMDLMGYLFGDILAVSTTDLIWIWAGGIICLATLGLIWKPLLALTVHEELARVEGVAVLRTQLVFMLLIAVVIAAAMKIVGVLLITALMIIPAATARKLSQTPEQMALIASGGGALSVALGLFASLQWDTPAGPSVVVAAAILFMMSLSIPARR